MNLESNYLPIFLAARDDANMPHPARLTGVRVYFILLHAIEVTSSLLGGTRASRPTSGKKNMRRILEIAVPARVMNNYRFIL